MKYRAQIDKMTTLLRAKNLEDNDKLARQITKLQKELEEKDDIILVLSIIIDAMLIYRILRRRKRAYLFSRKNTNGK